MILNLKRIENIKLNSDCFYLIYSETSDSYELSSGYWAHDMIDDEISEKATWCFRCELENISHCCILNNKH